MVSNKDTESPLGHAKDQETQCHRSTASPGSLVFIRFEVEAKYFLLTCFRKLFKVMLCFALNQQHKWILPLVASSSAFCRLSLLF